MIKQLFIRINVSIIRLLKLYDDSTSKLYYLIFIDDKQKNIIQELFNLARNIEDNGWNFIKDTQRLYNKN